MSSIRARIASSLPILSTAAYILDHELAILFGPQRDLDRVIFDGRVSERGDHLPSVIEDAIRSAMAHWTDTRRESHTSLLGPELRLEVTPIRNQYQSLIVAAIQRAKKDTRILDAATRFGLTTREVEVLQLLFRGLSLIDIGDRLHIAPSTAASHIGALIDKTRTLNRTAMLATVLGWESLEETNEIDEPRQDRA